MTQANQNGSHRIGYYESQLLTARDLSDDVAYESRMRGLHVRAMHNTWGVALGFEIKVEDNQLVQIGPGIAYDCQGREIISARTLNVGLPPTPSQSGANVWLYDLVISYLDPASSTTGDACVGNGISPHEERPVWRWRFVGDAEALAETPARADDLRLGEEIPLARFRISRISNEETISAPDFSERRNAQGLVRPHIAGDRVEDQFAFSEEQFAFSRLIDTAAAGFNRTPFYFADVSIPLLLDIENLDPQDVLALRRLLGPFVTIRNPWRTSFRLDVRFGQSPQTGSAPFSAGFASAALRASSATVAVSVNWVGIEPNGGCPPPLRVSGFFLFAFPISFVASAGVSTARRFEF